MTLYYAKEQIEQALTTQTELDYALASPGKLMPGTTYESMRVEFTIYCVKEDIRFQLRAVFTINGSPKIIEQDKREIENLIHIIKQKLNAGAMVSTQQA